MIDVARVTTLTGRVYTVKRVALEPLSYIVYFRESECEKEHWLHRDARRFDGAWKLVIDHIAQSQEKAA